MLQMKHTRFYRANHCATRVKQQEKGSAKFSRYKNSLNFLVLSSGRQRPYLKYTELELEDLLHLIPRELSRELASENEEVCNLNYSPNLPLVVQSSNRTSLK